MNAQHPTLERDAIREAVFELRFQRNPDVLPEIFFGKMADFEDWRAFKQTRLPFGEIPEIFRNVDPNLRHKALIELVSPDGHDAVQLGPDVVVLSRRGAYQGWDGGFGSDVKKVTERLFQIYPAVTILRLGLRYVNALQSDVHGVAGCDDLDLSLQVAQDDVSGHFSLNFKTRVGSDFEAMSRLATTDFAGGTIPDNTAVVLDIDVYTSSAFSASTPDEVFSWAKMARDEKNARFFSVLGPTLTEKLRKKA